MLVAVGHGVDRGRRVERVARNDVDVVITEVGGTVGDIEILPFLEAIRQFRNMVGRDNVWRKSWVG